MSAATVAVVMIAMLVVPILLAVLAAVASGVVARAAGQPRRGGRYRSLAVAR